MITHNRNALYIIISCEAIDRFSYFGLLTILVLFLTQQFHFSTGAALGIYSAYLSLAFSLPLIGGVLADRFLGNYYTIILGMCFSIIGNLLLSINAEFFFFLGLSIFLTGSGIFKPSSTGQVGLLFQEETEKHSAYTLFYVAMNVGAILGPLVFGIFGATMGWSKGFLVVALAQFCMLIRLLLYKKIFLQKQQFDLKKLLIVLGIMGLLLFTIYLFLKIPGLFNSAIIFLGAMLIFYLGRLVLKLNTKEKNNFVSILKLLIFGLVFFSISLQIGSSITLFIQHEINRKLLGVTLPTPLFSALDPLFVVLMAPVVTWLWQLLRYRKLRIIINYKIVLGLFFAALAMIIFALTSLIAAKYQHLSLLFIVFGNLCLGMGEISLSPAILAAISQRSPQNLHNTVMGCWYLFVSLAGYLSGAMAGFSQSMGYSLYFMLIALIVTIGFVCAWFAKLD